MVEKLMSPAPSSSYTIDTFDGIFIPRKQSFSDVIPCGYSPFVSSMGLRGSRQLILYFHGNAEDAGILIEYLQNFRNWFMVNVMAVEYPGYGLYCSKSTA